MLNKFATNHCTYRKSTETGTISDVIRLSATDLLPLRYKKTIKGKQSSLVDNEHRILKHCANKALPNIVQLLDYQTHFDSYNPSDIKNASQEITTKSSGVDIDHQGWLGTKLEINGQQYVDLFHNPFNHHVSNLKPQKSKLLRLAKTEYQQTTNTP